MKNVKVFNNMDGRIFQIKKWQLNVTHGSELDPGPEKEKNFFSFATKGIGGTIGKIWISYVDEIIVLYQC